jgi:hypothetical protein
MSWPSSVPLSSRSTALRLLLHPQGLQQIDVRLASLLIGRPDLLFDVSPDGLIGRIFINVVNFDCMLVIYVANRMQYIPND